MTDSERAYEVKKFTDSIFDKMMNVNCYEGVAYCLYFSLKYEFVIQGIEYSELLDSDDCILMLMGYLYFHKFQYDDVVNEFRKKAKELIEGSSGADLFEGYWLFIYEALSESELASFRRWLSESKFVDRNRWVELKHKDISFVKKEFREEV